MSMVRGNWDAFIASRTAFLRTVMVDESKRRPQVFPSIFNVESSDRYAEEFREVASLGLLQQIVTEIPDEWAYEDFTPRWTKTYTHNWYGLGMQFSKQFLMDNMDRFGAQRARELVKAAKDTQEYYAAAILNNMTATGTYAIPDALALASTAHTIMDNVLGGSATFSNYVNATLAEDSLEDALVIMDTIPNDRGKPEMASANRIVLHPARGPDAARYLQSIQQADSANGAINVVRANYDLTPITWHYLDSTTFWCMLSADHHLMWFNRQGIETDATSDFDNKSIKVTVDGMWSVGAKGWRGFVGGNT